METALRELKARAWGVPVYELFGGPLRNRQRLYWSHCGTYRVGARAAAMELPEVRSLDDIVKLGREVVARGYSALKKNIVLLGAGNTRRPSPGLSRWESVSALKPQRYVRISVPQHIADDSGSG